MQMRLWCELTVLLLLLLLELASAIPANVTKLIADSETSADYVWQIMRLSKAAEIRNFMNESVNPCDNFYAFACGKWARVNPAQLSELSTGQFERLMKGVHRKLTRMLKSEPQSYDTPEDLQVKRFYKSCLQLDTLRASYKQKLMQLIAEFGSMPVLAGDNWQEHSFDWLETSARMWHQYGITAILTVSIDKDFRHNQKNTLYIGHPDFALTSRSMYLDEHTAIYRQTYGMKIAEKLVNFLGLNSELAQQTANELVEFEVALAHGLFDLQEDNDLANMADLTTVADMQRRYAPTLDIERLVNVSLGEQVTDEIYEFNAGYQRHLITVLQGTPKRILANYVFYYLVDAFIIELPKQRAQLDEHCIGIAKMYFAKSLDNMIYRRYNNHKTADEIERMWHQLKSTFKHTLLSGKLDWIKLSTREYAIQKLAAMTLQINSYTADNLTAEFAGLALQDYDIVENVRQKLLQTVRRNREELHLPPKPLEAGELLSYTPANILLENIIKIPVSLLQPYYMWAASYPNAIMFGTLASLIGHELIHGFDSTGRSFDLQGNLNDWWDESSIANFQQRQKCFTKQYSHYSYNGRPLPEATDQSENIADNGGLQLAYAAYLNWYEQALNSSQSMRNERLPTLNYTSKQLFFISFAQIWCNDVHRRLRNLVTSTDTHVPGQYRVIGTLSNFDEFAKEFSCAAGTSMNRTHKCVMY